MGEPQPVEDPHVCCQAMKLALDHDLRRFAKDNPPSPVGLSVGKIYDLKLFKPKGERVLYHIPGYTEVKGAPLKKKVRVKPVHLNVCFCPFCGKELELVEAKG
jgi:hypothetical protein